MRTLTETDWIDKDGKEHRGRKETCFDCGAVLSTLHHGCCGHAASGSLQMGRHECPDARYECDQPCRVLVVEP